MDFVGGGGEAIGAEAEAFASAVGTNEAVAAEIAAGLATARLDEAETAGAGSLAQGQIGRIGSHDALCLRAPIGSIGGMGGTCCPAAR
jgi:hypothetical protein